MDYQQAVAEAYRFLREHNHTIPDEHLDRMKHYALVGPEFDSEVIPSAEWDEWLENRDEQTAHRDHVAALTSADHDRSWAEEYLADV